MLDHELVIVIPGRPTPKGSMKCVGRRGRVAHVSLEDDKSGRGKEWRRTLAMWVRRRWPSDQHAAPGQPLGAEITFTLPRPKSHYGTGRNAGVVKQRFVNALPIGHSTGDVDKLLRMVLDALQDTDVMPDDCAVIEALTRKTYVDGPALVPDGLSYAGVVIRLFPYDPAGAPS
jgi:Holliday junction resolvase RusA-like endonuclease